jgi:hypothetical protein
MVFASAALSGLCEVCTLKAASAALSGLCGIYPKSRFGCAQRALWYLPVVHFGCAQCTTQDICPKKYTERSRSVLFLKISLSFPTRNDGSSQAVAHKVGRGARHIHEYIHAKNQFDGPVGKVKLCTSARQNDQ